MMAALEKAISDIDSSFESFKNAELESWKESGWEIPPTEFLVKPSGSLSLPISYRLHQSSFTTGCPENGETADRTNG
jgi:hypothetical protein